MRASTVVSTVRVVFPRSIPGPASAPVGLWIPAAAPEANVPGAAAAWLGFRPSPREGRPGSRPPGRMQRWGSHSLCDALVMRCSACFAICNGTKNCTSCVMNLENHQSIQHIDYGCIGSRKRPNSLLMRKPSDLSNILGGWMLIFPSHPNVCPKSARTWPGMLNLTWFHRS